MNPEQKNTLACKMVQDQICQMMLHNSSRRLSSRDKGVAVDARWSNLGDGQPVLRVKIIGLAPMNWNNSQAGSLPNTNASPKDEPDPGMVCPDCGSIMAMESGCLICRCCGYDRCG